jgi:hypothetical protein
MIMAVSGCLSSGVFSASKLVSSQRTKLVSIHVTSNSNAANVIKVFDSSDASASGDVEIVRINTRSDNSGTNVFNQEYDMHGVVAAKGLWVEITGSGSCAVTVTFV